MVFVLCFNLSCALSFNPAHLFCQLNFNLLTSRASPGFFINIVYFLSNFILYILLFCHTFDNVLTN